jgi:histone-lysine N-methyltransferase SETMAR
MDNSLKNIATGVQSWVHHYDPENKRQFIEYRHPSSPSLRNSKLLHQQNVLLTIFWEARCVLYREFLTEGSTVNSDRHCATLRLLKQRIHRIRPERTTFLLHQGKARPHCSTQTEDAMTSLKFTLVPQPLYSSELASSDIWSFPKLKETLKG